MRNNKLINTNYIEAIILISVVAFIILHAIIRNDSIIATISATCGILYTSLAGKGLPACYLFGVTGSSFYSYLAFQNALWGNLLLYATYYVPMQILGYYKWKKNLKNNSSEIIKTRLKGLEQKKLICLTLILASLLIFIFSKTNNSHPILDGITTSLSIAGMYLTVKRAIEQWVVWFIVNLLSLIMWINVAFSGARVYSTIIMWLVYVFLSIYFYIKWHNEIQNTK